MLKVIMNSKTCFAFDFSLLWGVVFFDWLILGEEIDGWASWNSLDWSKTRDSTLLWKWSIVGLIDIVPVAADWVSGNWIEALDWWAVFQLKLGAIKVVWSLGVVVTWPGIGGDLSWVASSNRWPGLIGLDHGSIGVEEDNIRGVQLNLGSIEVVWSLGVIITWP